MLFDSTQVVHPMEIINPSSIIPEGADFIASQVLYNMQRLTARPTVDNHQLAQQQIRRRGSQDSLDTDGLDEFDDGQSQRDDRVNTIWGGDESLAELDAAADAASSLMVQSSQNEQYMIQSAVALREWIFPEWALSEILLRYSLFCIELSVCSIVLLFCVVLDFFSRLVWLAHATLSSVTFLAVSAAHFTRDTIGSYARRTQDSAPMLNVEYTLESWGLYNLTWRGFFQGRLARIARPAGANQGALAVAPGAPDHMDIEIGHTAGQGADIKKIPSSSSLHSKELKLDES